MDIAHLDLTTDEIKRLHLVHLISQGLSSANGLSPLYANCTDEMDPETQEKKLMGMQIAVDLSHLSPQKTQEILHWIEQLFTLLEDSRADSKTQKEHNSEPKITILSP